MKRQESLRLIAGEYFKPGTTIPLTGLGATDPDGTIASYTVNTLPPATEGVLFLDNPATGGVAVTPGQVLTPVQISQLFFQSTGTFNGSNFNYSATDNRGGTTPGTATVTPTPNQPPVINNTSVLATPGSAVPVTGLGSILMGRSHPTLSILYPQSQKAYYS